jgi:hypothetical protein
MRRYLIALLLGALMSFPTFKAKAEIPKGFEAAYVEKDGEWVPNLPDTSKADEALAKVRTEKKDLEKALKTATDTAADLQRQLDTAKISGVDFDKKSKELLDSWKKDTDALVKTERDAKEAALAKVRTYEFDNQLKAAILDAGARPDRVSDAFELNKSKFDLVDGSIVLKDEKGNITTTTPKDYFAKTWKAERPEHYIGTKASGGGAPGSSGKTPTVGSGTVSAEDVIKNPLAALKIANEEAK